MRGLGIYATLFGAIFLLLLLALVIGDNALQASFGAQAERDAEAVATEVEGAVAARISALRSLEALYLADRDDPADPARFARLVPVASKDLPRPFLRIAVLDASGAALHDTVLAGAPETRDGDSELATLARLAIGDEARTAAGAYVAPLRTRRGIVAVVVPLGPGGMQSTAAIGTFPASDLVAGSLADSVDRRVGVIVLAGADTVLRHGVWNEHVRHAGTPAAVPASVPWQVEAVHREAGPWARATLWGLGGAAVIFLVLGFFRERRQAERLSERSAELERLSTELLRSNRMKSEFLANISHELRTPLNAIVGFVELLRDGVYGELSPRQTNPVERIAGSATHLRHLVDQVLDIAKMAAGRLEVHMEAVVLRPFVLNVASELESLAADKGIVLSLTVSASLPRVRTDPSHLRQILVNLLGNAIKYTPAGGAVSIRTRIVGGPAGATWRAATPPPGFPHRAPTPISTRTPEEEPMPSALATRSPDPLRPWIAILVSDTGIGIAPEDHERIFEEFEQVNAGPRGESQQRGTGLGLPISRRLARLLGGDVTVDAEPGKGSTFIVWLPLEEPPAKSG